MPPESPYVRLVTKGRRIQDWELQREAREGLVWRQERVLFDFRHGRWERKMDALGADLYNLFLGRKGLTFRKRVESIHSNWQSTLLGFEITESDKNSDSQNKRDIFGLRAGMVPEDKVRAAPSAPVT